MRRRSRSRWSAGCWLLLCGPAALCGPCTLHAQDAGAAPTQLHTLGEGSPQKEAQLRAEIARQPNSAEAHYALAALLFQNNRPKDALAEYTRAAQLRPPTAAELRTVALAYVLLDDYTDADRWMTASLRMDATPAESWYDLGRIKYTENRFAESIDAFQHALKLSPNSVKIHDNLGLALEGIGRSADAAASYERALALQSGSAHPSEQPLLNYAILLINEGQPERALTMLAKAAAIAPNESRIAEQQGRANERLGRLPEAEASLRRAIALRPATSALHFQLGQILKREGKAEAAKEEFARVAELRGTKSDDSDRK